MAGVLTVTNPPAFASVVPPKVVIILLYHNSTLDAIPKIADPAQLHKPGILAKIGKHIGILEVLFIAGLALPRAMEAVMV